MQYVRGEREEHAQTPRRSLLARLKGRVFRRSVGAHGIRARKRGLPWVHSTIRVTRDTWRNCSGELHCRPRRLYSIRVEMLDATDDEYWEIVNRGTNFDYLEPRRRDALAVFYEWFRAGP